MPHQTPPSFTVTEVMTHWEWKDAFITVMCNGTCFYVTLKIENFKDAPDIEEQFVRHLDAAHNHKREEHEDDLKYWALEPLRPLLRQVDSTPMDNRTFTLHDYFYPTTLKYKLHAAGGILVALPDDNGKGLSRPGVYLGPPFSAFPWPLFRPSDISIRKENPKDALAQAPSKVLADKEKVCHFKAFEWGCQRDALDELHAYLRIEHSKMKDGLRVPHIVGLVQGEDSVSFRGMLLSFIDCGSEYGGQLSSRVHAGAPEHLRQRWAAQVTSTVKRLHEAGIVWGDAKAANVLVDINKDAWVIDFGGGYTEDWVEKEKAGTVEGDIQGLGKIVDCIFAKEH